MIQLYSRLPYLIPLLILLVLSGRSYSQCACGNGAAPQTIVHRTTISTSMESTNFSFPQFDPATGQLICADVKATITAVTRIRMENDEMFPAIYRINYSRTSTISGPGLNPTLVSSYTKNYGPYSLAESDGVYFSGPDYIITNRDTVLNKKQLTANISGNVTPFMGYGNVTYNYNLSTVSKISGGGNYLGGPLTTDYIDFTLTYSYCPTTVLATGLNTFTAELVGDQKVKLGWTSGQEQDGIVYTPEISRNGKDFTVLNRIVSNTGENRTRYSTDYQLKEGDPSKLYFRIRRTDLSGRVSLSEVRQVNIGVKELSISTYPNPATRKISIDLGKLMDGKMEIEISDPSGKIHQRSVLQAKQSRTLALNLVNMSSGIYFLRVVDQKSGKRYISRLAVSQ